VIQRTRADISSRVALQSLSRYRESLFLTPVASQPPPRVGVARATPRVPARGAAQGPGGPRVRERQFCGPWRKKAPAEFPPLSTHRARVPEDVNKRRSRNRSRVRSMRRGGGQGRSPSRECPGPSWRDGLEGAGGAAPAQEEEQEPQGRSQGRPLHQGQ
jgi:hypothetical protein